MTDRKTYVCKRTRMAAFLMAKGFQPYRIVPDRDNPVYNVYLFTESPELYKAVMEYVTEKRNVTKEGIQDGERKEAI